MGKQWKKSGGAVLIEYVPSNEENKAYCWCVNNNIRISPGGMSKDPKHWTIDISLDKETWHKSPKKYKPSELWPKFYEICIYYYNKNKKQ